MTTTQYRSFNPDLEYRADGKNRYVRGIAVPYDQPVRITNDLVEAFRSGVVDHQMNAANRVWFAREHIVLGGTLIGAGREMRNDAAGLWGEWKVSDTVIGNDTYELMKDGALRELSVGFQPVTDDRSSAPGIVIRTKVNLKEVAVVLEGAYGELATATVRSRGINLDDPEVRAALASVTGVPTMPDGSAVSTTPGLDEVGKIMAEIRARNVAMGLVQ